MFNNFSQEEKGIINAVLTQWGSFCNICGAKRSIDDIKIIRRTSDTIMMHITCNECKNSHFIQFNYNSSAFTMQQYSTDLMPEEISALGESAISTNDIIDTHIALAKVRNSKDLLKIIK